MRITLETIIETEDYYGLPPAHPKVLSDADGAPSAHPTKSDLSSEPPSDQIASDGSSRPTAHQIKPDLSSWPPSNEITPDLSSPPPAHQATSDSSRLPTATSAYVSDLNDLRKGGASELAWWQLLRHATNGRSGGLSLGTLCVCKSFRQQKICLCECHGRLLAFHGLLGLT